MFSQQTNSPDVSLEINSTGGDALHKKEVVHSKVESVDDDDECCCSLFPSVTTNKDCRPGSTYMFYEEMDEHNKAATDVLMTKGIDEAVKHMLTRPNGTPRTYAEMRELYG
jgi:hypothetical protein